MHHGDAQVAHFLRAALVHGRNLFGTFLLHPGTKLEDTHDGWIVLFGDGHRIADVVEVAVRANQNVDVLHVLFALRAHWIAPNPRIDVKGLPFWCFDTKCGVAEPGELDSLEIHESPQMITIQ